MRARLLVCFLLSAGAITAQTKSPSINEVLPAAKEVEITEKKVVEGRQNTNIVLPIVCDSKGNMYVRTIVDQTQLLKTPILRIKPNAESVLFDASRVPQLNEFYLREISVDDGGNLFQLGIEESALVIAKFSSSGQYSGKIKLEQFIDPYQFAAFPDGRFLVGGYEGGLAGVDLAERRPITALFDASGKMIQVLSLETNEGDKDNKHAGKLGSYSVVGALGEIGPDGNFYVLRPYVSKPHLYVVSPAGALIRQVPVNIPVKDGWPVDLKVSEGRALVLFSRSPKPDAPRVHKTYAVIDTDTGETLSTFKADFVTQGFPACYASDAMYFLADEKRMMAVAKAKLQ